MASCKSCGAEIEFVETRAGNSIPLDLGTVELGGKGNILISDDGDRKIAVVGSVGFGNRVSHFATCPNAPEHRKSRR